VPCPPGQGAAVADRCLPNGLVAKAAEKPMPASAIPAATTSLSVGENSPVGQPFSKDDRMSLAGPIPPVTPEPPGKTVRRPPSPPASVSPSGRFPGWAARAFESW
jgi:hypothetical protein